MGQLNSLTNFKSWQMSDSGISEASNDYSNELEKLEDVFDDDEEGKGKDEIPEDEIDLSCSFEKSDASSSPRSLIPLPASDIKDVNNDYQKLLRTNDIKKKLLKKATNEIKKLNLDVQNLEHEQEKLLQANVNLALETENLILDQNAWKKDEQALIKANGDLTKELERLHKVEQEQGEEIRNLQNQI